LGVKGVVLPNLTRIITQKNEELKVYADRGLSVIFKN
jgi:hypothetical protein